MSILTLRKNKVLYRTPSGELESQIFGNWYSKKSVARLYIGMFSDAKYVNKFKTTEELKLLDFTDIKTFEFLDKNLTGEHHKVFQQFTGYGLNELRIAFTNKKTGKEFVQCIYKNKPLHEIMICPEPDSVNGGEPGHLSLSKKICSFGFDGYFMPDKYMIPRDQKEKITFHQEIFLCKPKNVLKLVGKV
jgi:hypothetical protein